MKDSSKYFFEVGQYYIRYYKGKYKCLVLEYINNKKRARIKHLENNRKGETNTVPTILLKTELIE
ncbi:hypothetical protein LCGC14_0945570 [marine sediment metagenome]|uniref:Uncharacterized protein n=1 Tax=marine sediment metagenome TaxID=412755 RepID=A0A0F9P4X6_9ZZZZ